MQLIDILMLHLALKNNDSSFERSVHKTRFKIALNVSAFKRITLFSVVPVHKIAFLLSKMHLDPQKCTHPKCDPSLSS